MKLGLEDAYDIEGGYESGCLSLFTDRCERSIYNCVMLYLTRDTNWYTYRRKNVKECMRMWDEYKTALKKVKWQFLILSVARLSLRWSEMGTRTFEMTEKLVWVL